MGPVLKIIHLLTPAGRRTGTVLLVLMVVGMVLEMLGVGVVIPVIVLLTQSDIAAGYPAIAPVLEWLGDPSPQALIVGSVLALIGVYLVKFLFLAFLAWRQMRFIFGQQAELSQRLFEIYLRQSYTFHLQRNSAELIRNAVNEVQIFISNVLLPGMTLLADGLVLIGLTGLLLFAEPLGTIVLASIVGAAAWGFLHLTRSRQARWGRTRQHHDGQRIKQLQQGLGGAKEVKLLGREAYFLARYADHNQQSARSFQNQNILQRLPRLWLELLAVAGMAGLILILMAQGQEMTAILPTLALFGAAAVRLIPSTSRIVGCLQALRFALPVIDVLDRECRLPVPEAPAAPGQSVPFRDGLILDHVSYTYPGATSPALADASITVRPGEAIGFVGTSGAGKSTLVDIVLGLLIPDSGRVAVDGADIHEQIRLWQDRVGYVPQTIFLSDESLRRNIAFGLPAEQIDEAAVARALKAAQLEDFVRSLPDGLDTVVGERGVRLSGGQRQRIGIARALYHDPAILVLDEATSSLDTDTEAGVMEAVSALHGSKTILIVAHRLSTVAYCDRLYRLQAGHVVEEGTPADALPRWQRA